jgi:hypothetical protein
MRPSKSILSGKASEDGARKVRAVSRRGTL